MLQFTALDVIQLTHRTSQNHMGMIASVCTDASLTGAVVEMTRNILHQGKLTANKTESRRKPSVSLYINKF